MSMKRDGRLGVGVRSGWPSWSPSLEWHTGSYETGIAPDAPKAPELQKEIIMN